VESGSRLVWRRLAVGGRLQPAGMRRTTFSAKEFPAQIAFYAVFNFPVNGRQIRRAKENCPIQSDMWYAALCCSGTRPPSAEL